VVLNLEPGTEANAPATVKEVYDQIVKDLDESIKLLEGNVAQDNDPSHINEYAAKGMMARVALIMNNWVEAEKYSKEARAGRLSTKDEFASGFKAVEDGPWLWSAVVNKEQSTIYASYVSHIDYSIGGYAGLNFNPKFVSVKLLNQMTDGDIRKDLIVDTPGAAFGYVGYGYINYKFNAGAFDADVIFMRPAEMLLIEAEALARQGKDSEAQTLLLELRTNRQDNPVSSSNVGQALVDEILLERRIELWGEGFRLFDLKRTKSGYDRSGDNHLFVGGGEIVAQPEDDRFDRVVPLGEIDANQNFR
jgi:hypothetical protein